MSNLMNTIKNLSATWLGNFIPVVGPKAEGFEDAVETQQPSLIHSIIWWLITGFAIYLSWRCNSGFDVLHFLAALCCAPCYILYHLAATGLCGMLTK
jgi:hypothetical protein